MRHLQQLCLLVLTTSLALALPQEQAQEQPLDMDRLEREFSQLLSNAVLVGHFTDDAQPTTQLNEERYTLGAVTKVPDSDSKWRLETKIEYGKRSVTVPLVLDVEWAGDTPVITLTDYAVPLMGTFTARVLFYEGKYCGTWSGASHGGTLFGRIERAEEGAVEGAGESAERGSGGSVEGDDSGHPGGQAGGQAGADPTTDDWVAAMVEAGNWPSYRGPAARGVSDAQPLPERWDVFADEGIAFKTALPGLAHSSPVIWGDRIFLTSAVPLSGDEAELTVGLYGSIQAVPDEGEQDFLVLCLDRETGELLWETSAWSGRPQFPRHPKSSFAASTSATDGERVVSFFGSEGLFCHSAEDGELLWSRSFGELGAGFFMTGDQWGFAASPVIHGDRVLVQVDVLEGCFLAALDAATGEELWRAEREDVPTWCTPTVHVGAGRSQVLCNGFKDMAGYDLASGEKLWHLSGAGDIPVPTPVVGHGNVFLTSSHGPMSIFYAVPLGASGELDRQVEGSLSWSARPGTYMQTPLVYGDEVYYCTDAGALHCHDAGSGERLYRERVGGGGTGFTPSLVAGDGKLYVTSEEGTVHVLRAGREHEVLAVNELGETVMSTPAISGGRLYIRGRHHLFAVTGAGS